MTSTCIGNEVTVYDNKISGGELCLSLTHQLALLYRTMIKDPDNGEEIVKLLAVCTPTIRQQKDCSMFAIASALHTALGENMENIEFD